MTLRFSSAENILEVCFIKVISLWNEK